MSELKEIIKKILTEEYLDFDNKQDFIIFSTKRILKAINKFDLKQVCNELSISKTYRNQLLDVLEVNQAITEQDIEINYWTAIIDVKKLTFFEKFKIVFCS